MTVLSAQSINSLVTDCDMIFPFCQRTAEFGVTYGLSAAGYDVRVEFDKHGLIAGKIIAPGEYLLASTIERFQMPSHVIGIVHDKSTWARRGLAVQNTVIEPGWSGWLTLEITNHGNEPVELIRGVGIAQILFHLLDQPTILQYEGKYHNQERGPVAAKED